MCVQDEIYPAASSIDVSYGQSGLDMPSYPVGFIPRTVKMEWYWALAENFPKHGKGGSSRQSRTVLFAR